MTNSTSIRIGSRASKLAVIQAQMVQSLLIKYHPGLTAEIITLSTSGDRFVDRPLSEIGGKGLFTKELEDGLLRSEIDIAVHSMKDMATTLPDGLMVAATLEREDPRDMVVGNYASLQELPQGARFGTSSLRRAAQINMMRPDIKIMPFRGNVQTRLQKLETGEVDATMLACAGLNRLALDVPGFIMETNQLLPAVAQGVIAIQCRTDAERIKNLLSPLNHEHTQLAVECERAFLKTLDGSCRTPIAGYATVNGGNIELHGLIAKPDGSAHQSGKITGNAKDGHKLGVELGKELLAKAGAGFI